MSWRRHWPGTVEIAYAEDVSPEAGEEFVWRDDVGLTSIWKAGAGKSRHYRLRLQDCLAVDILAHDHFLARARTGTSPATLEHFLADQAAPRVVDHGGRLVLHAAAIQVSDSAILLMGASGRGKSTLAASFEIAGHRLLGDDATVVDRIEGGPLVSAIYPTLRLMPDSLCALAQDDRPTTPVADYTSKRRLTLRGSDRAPIPLAAAFVLQPAVADSITLKRLGSADSCMQFVENSFALDPTDAVRARSRFEQASALARAIPVFDFSFPRRYERLAEVRQALIDQMAESA